MSNIFRDYYLGDSRGTKLREDMSRLNMQIAQAEEDVAEQAELCRCLTEIMSTGAMHIRVTAALELPYVRDAQDKAIHKVKKLQSERKELKERIEAYNALRRYVHES